jgi:hypothetical protein
MANASPTAKPWGEEERKLLTNLVKQGKISINCDTDTAHIDKVQFNYLTSAATFAPRHKHKSLKTLSAALADGKKELKKLCLFFQLLKYFSHRPLSPIHECTEGDKSDKSESNPSKDDSSKDNNDTSNTSSKNDTVDKNGVPKTDSRPTT